MSEETQLKYPRRKTRKIGNEVHPIDPPDDLRSKIMATISSKNTRIEILMAKSLRENGIKYRNGSKIFGKPDFILFGYKVAIFCDGDFWHGYGGKNNKIKSNTLFWHSKIKRNIERDSEVNDTLKQKGWHVFRFWEHEINKDVSACIAKVKQYLQLVEEYRE